VIQVIIPKTKTTLVHINDFVFDSICIGSRYPSQHQDFSTFPPILNGYYQICDKTPDQAVPSVRRGKPGRFDGVINTRVPFGRLVTIPQPPSELRVTHYSISTQNPLHTPFLSITPEHFELNVEIFSCQDLDTSFGQNRGA